MFGNVNRRELLQLFGLSVASRIVVSPLPAELARGHVVEMGNWAGLLVMVRRQGEGPVSVLELLGEDRKPGEGIVLGVVLGESGVFDTGHVGSLIDSKFRLHVSGTPATLIAIPWRTVPAVDAEGFDCIELEYGLPQELKELVNNVTQC